MPPERVVRTIAIDWSGDRKRGRRLTWLAEVRNGDLIRLENGRTREELADHLIDLASDDPAFVVGLDFAFSFPAWFLEERALRTAYDLWRLAEERSERWLADCEPPFWGRRGCTRPKLPDHFRQTDREVQPVSGIRPKSPFQISGRGTVGTGSLRGMPILRRLKDAGFSIWPFGDLRPPAVIEIYPRLLTGPVTKSAEADRRHTLERFLADGRPELRELAAGSEDAFDAAISAVVMDRHRKEILGLEASSDPRERLEGVIWHPGLHGEQPARALVWEAGRTGVAEPWPRDGVDPGCVLCHRAGAGAPIAGGEHAVAFLDAYPVSRGHALIVSRRHEPDYFALTQSEQVGLWSLVPTVRRHLDREFRPAGYNIGLNAGEAAGQTVPHAHLHVIPRYPGDVEDPRGGVRHVILERAAWWERAEDDPAG